MNQKIFERYKLFYKNKYKAKKFFSHLRLKKLDNQIVPNSKGETRLFIIVKNEEIRLPYFLNYYFKRGIDRVLLVDNSSTDDTVSIALQKNNVHVFQTDETYENHWNWVELLLDKYGKDNWCLVVDADELFYYPSSESLNLKDIQMYLDKQKMTAIRCLLLDIYSNKPIKDTLYSAGEDPLLLCPYFDSQYSVKNISSFNFKEWGTFTSQTFTGGARFRVFGPAPYLISKIPMFKYSDKMYLRRGAHTIDHALISDIQGVVFHSKFLFDFIELVEREAVREEHFNKAIVYKIFLSKVRENPKISMYYDGSIKFKNSHQLIDLNIMKSSPEFEAFVSAKQKH